METSPKTELDFSCKSYEELESLKLDAMGNWDYLALREVSTEAVKRGGSENTDPKWISLTEECEDLIKLIMKKFG